MKLKNLLYSAGLLCLVALLVFLALGQDEEEPFLWSPEFGRMKADLVLHGVEYSRQSRGEDAVWDVDAEVARFYQDRDVMEFDRLNVVLKSDSNPVRIVADKGVYRLKQGDMEVSRNVRVYSSEGYVLETDSLRYVKDKDLVATDDRVLLLDDNGSRLEGDGFVYYLKEHRLVMKNPVALIPEEETGV